jgi:AcrR family transcriptional regulator
MTARRKYELKKRAERLEETRRRITEATIELHRTVGPAGTRISEVAQRAGVRRATVYNHFPDDAALFGACSAHWRSLYPAPDPGRWAEIADAGERLRTALRELYEWFRETETMTANVLRDAAVLPALRRIVDGGLGAYLERVRDVLSGPLGVEPHVRAAVRAATDFHFWRALSGLGDDDAAELGARLVEAAAAG